MAADPYYGLVLHNGALYADAQLFGRVAIAYFGAHERSGTGSLLTGRSGEREERGAGRAKRADDTAEFPREEMERRLHFSSLQKSKLVEVLVGLVSAERKPGFPARRAILRQIDDLLLGCGLTVIVGALLGPMIGSHSLTMIWAFLSLALFVMGFVYGPLGAWLPGLFPARVRYTGASMSFNVGGILGGGLAPMIAQALATHGGLALVGLYLAVAALLSLIGLLPFRQQA